MINNISESFPLSINLKGNLFSLKKPLVMGVLNFTQDSFYKGSRFTSLKDFEKALYKMVETGADVIDIGVASSRPGAKLIDANDEIEVLIPLLKTVVKEFPAVPFSIDTYHSKTAKAAVQEGATIVNDISAGMLDQDMYTIVASLNVPYVMMHMQGIPENMQDAPNYNHVVKETIDFFVDRVGKAKQAGIKDIIIDPGFGFGKRLEDNYHLLQQLNLFKIFNLPILVGLSRKSIINKVLKTNADQALNGTTVLNTIALLNGANLLRVHDVLEAKQTIELVQFYYSVR
jgi:dihydropteroate synthase